MLRASWFAPLVLLLAACATHGSTPKVTGSPGALNGPCVDSDLCDFGLHCSSGHCVSGEDQARAQVAATPPATSSANGTSSAGGASMNGGAGNAGGSSSGSVAGSAGQSGASAQGTGGSGSGGTSAMGGRGGAASGTGGSGGTSGSGGSGGGSGGTFGSGGTSGGSGGAGGSGAAGTGATCKFQPAVGGHCNPTACLCSATNKCIEKQLAATCCSGTCP